MDHLPLKLGVTYTTALGHVTFTRIGKHGKWAFDVDGAKWRVETGQHSLNPIWNTTGRVEPAPVPALSRRFVPVRMIEAAPIEAVLARVTAERDEAVALVREAAPYMCGTLTHIGNRIKAFLAKIGGK